MVDPFLQPLGAKLRAKVAGSPFDRGRSRCSHWRKQSARTCLLWGSGGPLDSIGGGSRATSVQYAQYIYIYNIYTYTHHVYIYI